MLGLCDVPKHAQRITSDAYEDTECCALMDDVLGGGLTVPECIANFLRMVRIACEKHIMLNPGKTDCCCSARKASASSSWAESASSRSQSPARRP